MKRSRFTDLAWLAALGALVGVEVASLASAADHLYQAPSGIVLDAASAGSPGIAVDAPVEAALFDDRVACGESSASTDRAL